MKTSNQLTAVITTIQLPTPSVRQFAVRLLDLNAKMIVVGDKKGPPDYELEGAKFLSLAGQLASGMDLALKLPVAHYARKNLGYLEAISQGANCIYETDDDNAPLNSWVPRTQTTSAYRVEDRGWVNVYRLFSDQSIWPRGFPLNSLTSSFAKLPTLEKEPVSVRASIQQGLVNNSPDVDAIWRLVMDRPFDFGTGPSVLLTRGSWCPFNSQSTWWFPVAYPLMYLPSFCSFRMTDIWRSFIAQRCLWELDLGIVFHAPEVVQERNHHDLMRDFSDELPGYTRNEEIIAALENLTLKKGIDGVSDNLILCYGELVKAGVFSFEELTLVDAWLNDLEKLLSSEMRPSVEPAHPGIQTRTEHQVIL